MTATNRWTPATIPAHDPVDPDPRSKPIEWGQFTPGLEVKRLDPSELTKEQRRAFGIGDDDET